MKYFILILLSTMALQLSAGKDTPPEWLNDAFRKSVYPNSRYFTGYKMFYASNPDSINAKLNEIENLVVTDLASSISVSVEKETKYTKQEQDGKVTENYTSKNILVTRFKKLPNIIIEKYYCKKQKAVYGFAYLSKQKLLSYYETVYESTFDKAKSQYRQGMNYKENDSQSALKAFLNCKTQFNACDEISSILYLLGSDMSLQQLTYWLNKVDSEINSIQNADVNSLDELASSIVNNLDIQLDDVALSVHPFTYEDSELISKMSYHLSSLIHNKCHRTESIKVINEDYAKADHLLVGEYWEYDDRLYFDAKVTNVITGEESATAGTYLPITSLDTGVLAYKPDRIKENLETIAQLQNGDGEISVDIITNKGDYQPIFSSGEEMRLQLKVSYPCFVRVVYILANGIKTLLMDDIYISADYVNKMYPIGATFECAQPFGVENIKVFASSEKFPALETFTEGRYVFVTSEIDEMIRVTRENNTESVKTGEGILTITTIP